MCRIFGSLSLHPEGVARAVLLAENALRVQSREHPDGWGVAWYVAGAPTVVRSLEPAHADASFEDAFEAAQSQAVIAHVRKASVGGITLENTHPFEHGRWVFVHNGTLPDWERAQPLVEAQLDPALRRGLRGETDSERCFALFLTRLRLRCDPDAASFDDAVAALRETVALVRAASETAPAAPASTTFVLSDGRLLLGCRRGRTLHTSHPAPGSDGRVAWFAVSSEAPGTAAKEHPDPWELIGEDRWCGVDGELRLRHGAL